MTGTLPAPADAWAGFREPEPEAPAERLAAVEAERHQAKSMNNLDAWQLSPPKRG